MKICKRIGQSESTVIQDFVQENEVLNVRKERKQDKPSGMEHPDVHIMEMDGYISSEKMQNHRKTRKEKEKKRNETLPTLDDRMTGWIEPVFA